MSDQSLILIVDDEPVGREALEGPLLNQGYTLEFAADGPEAIAQALALKPDVILLDVMMPGMTGFEVCQRLRTEASLAEVPIVMVTALDDRRSRLQGLEAGADDFLSKPFDRAELRARVRTITRLNRYRRLQAERARFEWVVENAAEGYLILNEADAIVYANAQARLYLGIESAEGEPVAGPFVDWARAHYRLEPENAWDDWPAQSLFSRRHPHYLVRPETENATAFWLKVDVLEAPGGLSGERLLRLSDITAGMVSQRNTWSFHSIISHKLRTPIAAMQASLDYLYEFREQLTVEEITQMSHTALQGARRLRGEVEDIMRFMRDHRLTTPETEPCPLAEVPTLINAIATSMKLETVTVTLPDSSAALALSSVALELALTELLENARKFHPRQTPCVEVRGRLADDGALALQIWDDGHALSPEQLAQVWTPYYQGEKYFTGESKGMGLGLPMVASLVWEAGGQCRMYNRPDDAPGIVVELNLPVVAPSL